MNVAAASCAGQCPSCDGDPDADGLKGDQDPWPTSCNRLLLSEGFTSPSGWLFGLAPYAASEVHVGGVPCGVCEPPCYCAPGHACVDAIDSTCMPPMDGVSWACGHATLAHYCPLGLLGAKGVLTDPYYLTEVRFTPGPVASGKEWRIGMVTNIDDKQRRTCEVWYSASYSPYVSLHSVHIVAAGSTGMWQPKPGLWPKDLPAGSYLLQAWGDGKQQHCRLLDTDGKLIGAVDRDNSSSGLDISPKTPGTIRVHASGRSVTLDHVRVFQGLP